MWTEPPGNEGGSGGDCLSHQSPQSAPGNICFCLVSSCSLNYGGVCLASDAQFSDFLGSMGPAQFVGRQTLATTPMGECPGTYSQWGRHKPSSFPSSPLPWPHPLSTQPRALSAPAGSAEPGCSCRSCFWSCFWVGAGEGGFIRK